MSARELLPRLLQKDSNPLLRCAVAATLTSVTDEGLLNHELVAEVETMLRDGTVEGMARRLRCDFPSLATEADGAIGQAVEKLIQLRYQPRDCRRYLAAISYNEMKRLARNRAAHESLDKLAADVDEDRRGWEPTDSGPTVEEQALRRDTYDLLRSHVATWETENVRVVTLLYLEAAYEGEPLPSEVAAELARESLGYDVDANFVRVWKSRGFRKLRDFVATADLADAQREESIR